MLKICQKTQLPYQKCTFMQIQDGGSRHLECRKGVAISLLLNQSSSNLVRMLRICHRTQLSYQKCTFTKIKDGGRRHLEFWKCVAISLLLNQSLPNLARRLRIWHRTQLFDYKSIITKVQDGGRHYVEFDWICIFNTKVAFKIEFAIFPWNLARIGPLVKKWQQLFEIKDGGGRHL